MRIHAALPALFGSFVVFTACGGEYQYAPDTSDEEPLFRWQPLEATPAYSVPRACAGAEQHFAGDLSLFGQRSTEEFSAMGVLEGSLVLAGAADLGGLRCLRRVEGDVVVQGTDTLVDMSDFSSLREIGGSLVFRENTSLTSLRGLEQLHRIGDSLVVERNEALVTLTELASLGGFLHEVRIRDNDNLQEIRLFPEASATLQLLDVSFNPSLERLSGFEGVQQGTRVSGGVTVAHNDALERASLPMLSFGPASDGIRVEHNGALVHLDLVAGKQTWLPGDLILADNAMLQRLTGFASLRQVAGDLHVSGNPRLASLDAFETLLRIDGSLWVEKNHGLTDVNLGALRVIYGDLFVGSNHGLTSLQGFASLAALRGALAVERNPRLAPCDIDALQRQVQRASMKTACPR